MNEHQTWEVAGKPSGERRIRGEQQRPSKQPLWRTWSNLPSVMICIAACVLCLGVCIVVLLWTSELQTRVVSLEKRHRDAQLSAWMFSLEQVEPVILGRLDQILDEKLAARIPKTRESREAPHSCLCPPGKLLAPFT
ncbi:col13a1 [Pungitius sinensis]